LLFGISLCELDHGGRYVLDLVVVVEPLEDEDEEDEDEDEEDEVVEAEEEPVLVEELAVVVDAPDEINELGAPPDNVNGKL
jgi:hypothetical protein